MRFFGDPQNFDTFNVNLIWKYGWFCFDPVTFWQVFPTILGRHFQ